MVGSGNKKHLGGVAAAAMLAACSLSAPAHAADLPTQAPVLKAAPLPMVNWTGFYLGLGGGYGMYTAEASPTNAGVPVAPQHDTGGQGFFGTAIAGFDWQFTNRFVAGVFADYDFGNIEGDHTLPVVGFGSSKLKMSSAWSVGGRGGWLVSPSVLSYFTAGYTQAQFEGSNVVPGAPGLSLGSKNFGGYFLGGGVEAMFAPGWSVRGEYRYSVYDTEAINLSLLPAGSNLDPKVQTVRAVVTRKFGVPGSPSYPAFAGTPTTPAAWNGLYVFGGGGLGVFNNDFGQTIGGIPVAAGAQTVSGKGYFGTVGGGYDWAVSNRVVLGAFADYDLSSIKGRAFSAVSGFGEATLNWSWAIGGRIGVLADPSTMFYGTAGYTQAHFDGYTYLPLLAATSDTTYNGWFVGAGVERGLWNNFTLRTEYRYAKYSDETVQLTVAGVAVGIADRHDIAVQTVRSTLAYKFNWMPAAVTVRN
jgi:outer membrane immunogenic protein